VATARKHHRHHNVVGARQRVEGREGDRMSLDFRGIQEEWRRTGGSDNSARSLEAMVDH